MKTVTHVIADPLGLHARPAGLLVKLAAGFESAIVVTTSTGTASCTGTGAAAGAAGFSTAAPSGVSS